MKTTLKKHHKALIGMAIIIAVFLLLDTPVGQPSQMYAVVIDDQVDKPDSNITFALQNGVEVKVSGTAFTKGEKIKLWVKKTRFSKKRVYSLSPDFEDYVLAENEF
ncbi:hypothetical protein QX776_00225 [Alteromonadaceae bacterium BrNp21-10]|nr:hypothetical protein [Alteromonadaceae bacterium BrNp21-10]